MKPTHQTHPFRRRATIAAVALGAAALAAPAFGQSGADLESLRAEMRAAREAYESRIAELERRLATVERSTTENTEAIDEVFTPEFMTEGLPANVTRNFELHGYLRAGYGINQSGGGQRQITNPDGLFEIGPGRLGNEQDTYGELGFHYTFPRASEESAQFKFVGLLAFKYSGDKSNYTVDEDGDVLFREAYIEASNFLKGNPGVTAWAGQRFYDRHDIHINDFYFLDLSGYGGGVDGIDVGPGKLAIAYIGGTDNDAVLGWPEYNYTLTKQVFDVRLKELPVLGGKGMLWAAIHRLNGNEGFASEVYKDKEVGYSVGWVQFNSLSKGFNKASLMYGEGAGAQFNTYLSSYFDTGDTPRGSVGRQEKWLLTNQTVWQFNDKLSVMGALIYEFHDLGSDPSGPGNYSDGDRHYTSVIVRPIYMFTDHLGLQFEAGYDWVDDVRWTPGKDSAKLGKLTIAPTIKPSGAFWTRPELRLYASYFFWDDAPDYFAPNGVTATANGDSWSFGIQAETWW